jgi:flagellar assembly protein FliH
VAVEQNLPLSSDTLESMGHTAESLTWQPGDIGNSMALQAGSLELQTQKLVTKAQFVTLTVSDWPSAEAGDNKYPLANDSSVDLDNDMSSMPSIWLPQDIEGYTDLYGSYYATSRVGSNTSPRVKQAYKSAFQVVSSAQDQAQEIISEAEIQAREIIAQAENEAKEQINKAYAEGLDASNQKAKAMLATVSSIVDEVQQWKNDLLNQGEMMMLRLIIEIAQTIFGDGLPLDPDTLGQAFSRALAQARSLGDLRIYVNPEDAIALSSHWSKMQTSFGGQNIEMVPSEVISRGGCFIDGDFGSVDARVETQFEIAKDSLLATLEKPKVSGNET